MGPSAPEAGAPVAAAKRFFDAVGALAWSDLAASVHAETLELYRYHVTSILDADEENGFAVRVFGVPNREEILSRRPGRLFAELAEAIYKDTPGLIQVMATNSYSFLGPVFEGDTLAHVVARVTPYTNGSAPTRLTTVTVKQSERGWRVLESPELDALSTAMRGLTFRSDNGPTTGWQRPGGRQPWTFH